MRLSISHSGSPLPPKRRPSLIRKFSKSKEKKIYTFSIEFRRAREKRLSTLLAAYDRAFRYHPGKGSEVTRWKLKVSSLLREGGEYNNVFFAIGRFFQASRKEILEELNELELATDERIHLLPNRLSASREMRRYHSRVMKSLSDCAVERERIEEYFDSIENAIEFIRERKRMIDQLPKVRKEAAFLRFVGRLRDSKEFRRQAGLS